TLRVDCDVINADGRTRCASITGAGLALRMALKKMVEQEKIAALPDILPISAISVGIVSGKAALDLDYEEDSSAEVDTNFVMAADGRWIEAQATAEGQPFAPEQFTEMAGLAWKGIQELLEFWEE
ncbi:MAG: ribonuclease PH, partial [Candidatus Electrothrix sp. GM3_4]|nr:ribonuclease PH [Candidatus Electrothrix sp. GM3_4]